MFTREQSVSKCEPLFLSNAEQLGRRVACVSASSYPRINLRKQWLIETAARPEAANRCFPSCSPLKVLCTLCLSARGVEERDGREARLLLARPGTRDTDSVTPKPFRGNSGVFIAECKHPSPADRNVQAMSVCH
ncbi:hypothetical protein E2C01_037924 [Portunus trituberculatus]|uniref:Uncharacterized protein n=1 Tax=Portunus trituberculatus TaxID=210409 RepID=A0A5B7FFD5_PORTR|nr:hypothetical protein [Portunus trituberculatus]